MLSSIMSGLKTLKFCKKPLKRMVSRRSSRLIGWSKPSTRIILSFASGLRNILTCTVLTKTTIQLLEEVELNFTISEHLGEEIDSQLPSNKSQRSNP